MTHRHHLPRHCLLAVSLLFLSWHAQAETITEYAVDLVIFEDAEARYINSEQWSADVAEAAPEYDEANISEDNKNGDQSLTEKLDQQLAPVIQPINSADYDLLDTEVAKLAKSKRYHLLARKTWLQPGLDKNAAIDVDISEADRPQLKESDANAANTAEADDLTGSISGTVKVVLERYLHLYTDLKYIPPLSVQEQMITESEAGSPVSPNESAAVPTEFAIRIHRRMRSKELHYLDHPLVGMLVKIIPVEMDVNDSKPSSPVPATPDQTQ